jgi:hypothetical protein
MHEKLGPWWHPLGWMMGVVATALVAIVSCTTTPAPVGLAEGCSINSDCQGSLVCAFGRCHVACVTSKDCSGGMCVLPGVCELPSEARCSSTLPCVSGLTCVGATCLATCSSEGGAGTSDLCLADQACVSAGGAQVCAPVDAGASADAARDAGHPTDGTVRDTGAHEASPPDRTIPPESGRDTGTRDAGSHDAAHDAHDAADTSLPCLSPDSAFGVLATGDPSLHFTSGVALRTATKLFVFSGYEDSVDAAGGAGGAVWVQAFDVLTGQSLGAATELFPTSSPAIVFDAVMAASGEIAVLYSPNASGSPFSYAPYGSSGPGYFAPLYAALLGATSDGGVAGLEVAHNVEVEPNTVVVQPHAIWSEANGAFVFSYEYISAGVPYVKARRIASNGTPAGADTATLPVREELEQGAAAATGSLVGLAYVEQIGTVPGQPYFSLFDANGNPVDLRLPRPLGPGTTPWVAVAGTPSGILYLYEYAPIGPAGIQAAFFPVVGDAGVLGDGGFSGDAGALFSSFAETSPSVEGRAISEGAGGFGAALLSVNSVGFAYFNGQGVRITGPSAVLTRATPSMNDEISISSFGSGFAIALFNGATGVTEVAASGCFGQ